VKTSESCSFHCILCYGQTVTKKEHFALKVHPGKN